MGKGWRWRKCLGDAVVEGIGELQEQEGGMKASGQEGLQYTYDFQVSELFT